MKGAKHRLSYARIIALGFALVILIGAALLALPVASSDGSSRGIFTAAFTSVSATCVTGLVVVDTAVSWSIFGQAVILLLIQIGGIGFMTVISLFSIALGKKIGLFGRRLIMQSAGTLESSGIIGLVKRIAAGTAVLELLGAALLSVRFIPDFGIKGIWYAVFHSVSAFCNAGFDILGAECGAFSSFTSYAGDPLVCLTLASLIVVGGLGFIVWSDIIGCRFRFRRMQLHTKIVLTVTGSLLVAGTVLFLVFENNASLSGMGGAEKLLASVFQSVSPRTAGFNTVDMAKLSPSGSLLTDFLMLVGGSPGSTAGGIKTTSLFVLIAAAITSARGKNDINCFKKRLENGAVRQAASVAVIYLMLILIATPVICAADGISLDGALFETVSAVGTVGLSKGLTPQLGDFSRAVLMFLMYAGRVGGLTLFVVIAEKKDNSLSERPEEKILIG